MKINMFKENKGLMGVGTLIVFIAVVLVAAVAAAVLISTASSLQQRGVATGVQAEEGVATGVEVISVMGTDGAAGHDLEHFEMYLRLSAGSETVNLNNTVIIMDTADTSQSIQYGTNVSTIPSTTTAFNVEYLKKGPDYEANYLSRGDVIKIRFNHHDVTSGTDTTGGVSENKIMRIKIIPRVGTATIVEFTTPDVITDQRVTLWP